jgi:hypothetical protein
VDQDIGIVELNLQLFGIGDEIGREIAAVELHALHRFKLGCKALGFLDGDNALIADLVHRFGEDPADFVIAIGRDGGNLGDLAVGNNLLGMGLIATTALTAKSMPRFRSIGFMPAPTALAPSRTMAWASTVAVVVPSPALSFCLLATSRSICAPMFSNLSLSSISLATETPSLVMRGAPKLFRSPHCGPWGRASPSLHQPACPRRAACDHARAANFTSLAAMMAYLLFPAFG